MRAILKLTLNVDISNYPKGMYFIEIKSNNNSKIKIKRIGIGLSGGKDSTVALNILKMYFLIIKTY